MGEEEIFINSTYIGMFDKDMNYIPRTKINASKMGKRVKLRFHFQGSLNAGPFCFIFFANRSLDILHRSHNQTRQHLENTQDYSFNPATNFLDTQNY